MKSLRPYQEIAIEKVLKGIEDGHDKQMLEMATGTGKTVTATNILSGFSKALWVTHTEELIDQSASVLGAELGQAVGIIKAERMEVDCPITVASIQTLHRRLGKIAQEQFDVIVFDECHMCGAITWTKTAEHFKPKLRLGLTATPWRTDGASLDYLFPHRPFSYSILNGIEDGYLSDLKAIRLRTNIQLDQVRTTAGEFNLGDLTEVVDCPERNEYIVDSYIEHAGNRQAIAFCVDVRHAMNLCQAFLGKGIAAEFVVGDKALCPDRSDRIARYKSGETQVLVNVMVLTMGFDHPETGCIIMACPTKSKVKFVQCVGRGTRLKEHLENCIIMDVVDVTRRHRLVNSQTLDLDVDADQRIFDGSEARHKAAEEKERRRMLAISRQEEDVDLFALPVIEKPAGFDRWKNDPATEKQLALLKKRGHPVADVQYTKGHAYEIISNDPASDKQIMVLARRGYDLSNGCSFGQASAVFDDWDKKKEAKAKEQNGSVTIKKAKRKNPKKGSTDNSLNDEQLKLGF